MELYVLLETEMEFSTLKTSALLKQKTHGPLPREQGDTGLGTKADIIHIKLKGIYFTPYVLDLDYLSGPLWLYVLTSSLWPW